MDEARRRRILDSPPEALKEALKGVAVGYCNLFKAGRTFGFRGRRYSYFYHPYNMAWRNERTIEVPIAREFLRAHEGQAVLEVGNVLSHYGEVTHDVLDKYESSAGVINEDAARFRPGRSYDLILSVSTLEHVGWDESPREPDKAAAVIGNLVSLLAPGGEFVATAPLGYNPTFDSLLASGRLGFDSVYAMKRRRGNRWEERDLSSLTGVAYNRSAFRADAIVVGLASERAEHAR